jgi:hypothetical protein
MTPEERRADLEKAGVDVDKLHADTRALLERAANSGGNGGNAGSAPSKPAEPSKPPNKTAPQGSPAKVVPLRRLAPTPLFLLAACAVGAGVATAIYFGVEPDTLPPPVVPQPPPPPPAPSRPAGPDIATLRKEGLDACTDMHWALCQEKLTLANRYDPAGASDPVLSLALRQAQLALTPRDGGEAPDENAKRPPPVPTGRRGPL